MNDKMLIEQMTSSVEGVPPVPPRAEVIAVRQHSLDELEQRARSFLDATGEAFSLPLNHRDWVVQNDQTLIRMPFGARAVVYHASGAMKLVIGLKPMELIFNKLEEREKLVELVKETAERLKLYDLVKQNETLRFERLWQIKAAAADRKSQTVEPVLCRVVGAYRHFVGELPVWGAASVAVKLAGEGVLDSLTVQMRESTGEVIDRVEILRPEQAARQVFLQLSRLMGQSKIPVSEVAKPRTLRFGYLSLPKRKTQRVLAPVYIAEIEIEGQEVSQAYVLVTPATEKTYLPLPNGSEAPPTPLRRTE
ncbi:MAG: hypothetical protein O9326_14975 [Microcystis sp. LE19-338.1B]|jgi:hypothetical protein|nr:hypothetical protein [Microcystis sp. LE19-338.1B]MCZ8360876.1 hypothetical protein [Microcystis sp. LE19-388.1G]